MTSLPLDFDRRAIVVYGISPSEDPPPLSRCFSKTLAENESVSVCKAYSVGAMGTNNRSRARLLKVILSNELDLELLLSHRKKLASFAPSVFFSSKLFPIRALEVSGAEGRNSAQVESSEASLSMLSLNIYHVVSPVTPILIPPWNIQNFYLSGSRRRTNRPFRPPCRKSTGHVCYPWRF